MIELLRGILLKTRDWTLPEWEEFNKRTMYETQRRNWCLFPNSEKPDFLEKLLEVHFGEILQIKVADRGEWIEPELRYEWKKRFSLDITDDERALVQSALIK